MKNKNLFKLSLMFIISLISFILLSCSGNINSSSPAADANGNVLVLSGLSGSLQLDNGSPAANADVQVESHPEYNTKTDANGKLNITNILPGTYTIYIETQSVASLSIKNSNKTAATRAIDTSKRSAQFSDLVLKSTETTTLPDKKLTIPGSLSGTVVLINNPNNIDLAGIDVYVPGTSFIAKTDSSGNFSLSNLPEGSYNTIRFDKSGLTSSELKDVKIASNTDTALGAINMSLSIGPSGEITGLANSQAITIDGSARNVLTTNTVTINLIYDTRAVLMKVAHETSFTNTKWVPVSKSYTFTEANNVAAYSYYSSDGLKNVFVKLADLNGLESSPVSISFYIDTAAPVISEVIMVNGWAQTGSSNVFVDIVASDSSTGIKEIMISNSSSSFNSGETWQTFSPRMNWTLPAGAGSKTIYVKVRDYLGNESNVKSDSINLGTQTLIFSQTYDTKMTLSAAQGPYLIQGPVTFNSDLEIEAGTTIYVNDGATITVKGVFTSVGTAANRIYFTGNTLDFNACISSDINLYEGQPGVSEANRIQYTTFQKIGSISLNGGIVSNNIFDNSKCSNVGGWLKKNGLDNLNISTNTFNNMYYALIVFDGNGNTTFENNTGTAYNVISQEGTANNTKIYNNTFSCAGGTIFSLNNGNLSMSGNDFSGNCYALKLDSGISSASVSGLEVNGCGTIIYLMENQDITITHSKFINCIQGISLGIGANNIKLTISNSDIFVSDGLISSPGSSIPYPEITLSSNNITCANNSGYCDLYSKDIVSDYSKVTLSGNNIDCSGDATKGCRGFVVAKSSPEDRSGTIDFVITGNYWNGKTLPANLALPANIITGSYDYPSTISHATEIRIFQFSPDCSAGTMGSGGCPAGDMNVLWNFDAYGTLDSPITEAGYK